MREAAKVNAMRSGVVVVGALAFGYLTFQLGFRPFLEKAQLQQALHNSADPNDDSDSPPPPDQIFSNRTS